MTKWATWLFNCWSLIRATYSSAAFQIISLGKRKKPTQVSQLSGLEGACLHGLGGVCFTHPYYNKVGSRSKRIAFPRNPGEAKACSPCTLHTVGGQAGLIAFQFFYNNLTSLFVEGNSVGPNFIATFITQVLVISAVMNLEHSPSTSIIKLRNLADTLKLNN